LTATTTASTASAPSPPAAPQPRPNGTPPATRLTTPAASWTHGTQTYVAPQGQFLEQVIEGDWDGDGTQELVAWALPSTAPGPAQAGTLWLIPAKGEPQSLATTPAFLPAEAGCSLDVVLLESGKQTVTLDTSTRCASPGTGRAPTRGIQVIAPARSPHFVMGLRVASAAPGEQLTVNVDSHDRDGDGRDDLTFDVNVSGPAADSEPTAGSFIWFDRPAGIARDTSEPGATLASLAGKLLSRAQGRKTAAATLARIGTTRRWLDSACSESGSARITMWDGTPLPCGALDTTAAKLLRAETTALVTDGKRREALGALSRATWSPWPPSDKSRQELAALATKSLPRRSTTRIPLDISAPPASGAPRWSPLTFDGAGSLTVLGTDGTATRFDTRGTRVSSPPVEDGGAPPPAPSVWSTAFARADGLVLRGLHHDCDRNELLLELQPAQGGTPTAVPTDLLAARPGPCTGRPAPKTPVVPIGFTTTGPVVLIEGIVTGPGSLKEARAQVPPGSALSPDGRWLVSPTPEGLFVEGASSSLWEVEHAEDLTDCVIAPNATAAACLRGGQPLLILPGAKP